MLIDVIYFSLTKMMISFVSNLKNMLRKVLVFVITFSILTMYSKNSFNFIEYNQKDVKSNYDYLSPEQKKEAYFFESYAYGIYSQIFKKKEIDFTVFEFALDGFNKIKSEHLLKKDSLLTIIDFSKASNSKRFFTIDIKNKKILYQSLVAHGVNSGVVYATHFSNRAGSRKSSLGFYVTNETYIGSNGFSLKLDGLEKLFNSNARLRGVVIHGASYVNNNVAEKTGRIGRSFGCPALPMSSYHKIIENIKGQSCVFIFAPNSYYLLHSNFINPVLKAKLVQA